MSAQYVEGIYPCIYFPSSTNAVDIAKDFPITRMKDLSGYVNKYKYKYGLFVLLLDFLCTASHS